MCCLLSDVITCAQGCDVAISRTLTVLFPHLICGLLTDWGSLLKMWYLLTDWCGLFTNVISAHRLMWSVYRCYICSQIDVVCLQMWYLLTDWCGLPTDVICAHRGDVACSQMWRDLLLIAGCNVGGFQLWSREKAYSRGKAHRYLLTDMKGLLTDVKRPSHRLDRATTQMRWERPVH